MRESQPLPKQSRLLQVDPDQISRRTYDYILQVYAMWSPVELERMSVLIKHNSPFCILSILSIRFLFVLSALCSSIYNMRRAVITA